MADSKDWTWVLTEPCPACGFDAAALPRDQIGARTRRAADAFAGYLGDPDVAVPPAPYVWSTLEYACHIRDVCRVMQARLELMLATDGARFENWDQDATAIEDRYDAQDPAQVAVEVLAAAAALADGFDAVTDAQWANRGVRSNGSAFTVESLGRYLLHDLEHHVWDVEQARSA